MTPTRPSEAARPVQSCTRCLYTTSHPLGLVLDEDGVCSGCRIHEEKDRLNWDDRWQKLRTLVEPYRVKTGKTWDCIVPVTGANDSYFIVHLVKERLGLNPLLVTYNKYFNTPIGIRNLANLRTSFNCDILIQNVNPHSVKNITRTTVREFGSIYWPCLAGQTAFPVQTAVRYKIPLIIWGAHQGLEQVGMFSHEHEVEMSRWYRKNHDLMGHEADDLLSIFDSLGEDDIWQYRYPDDASIDAIGVRGIYLGNYVRWDAKAQHEAMRKSHAYWGAGFSRTFDTYDHADCFNYMGLHDQLKLIKHGYSKVTDHACREIRHGRLTRDAARQLVARHEEQPAEHVDLFCDWANIHPNSLQFLLDRHRGQRQWTKAADGTWLRQESNCTTLLVGAAVRDPGFVADRSLCLSERPGYITIGKGSPE